MAGVPTPPPRDSMPMFTSRWSALHAAHKRHGLDNLDLTPVRISRGLGRFRGWRLGWQFPAIPDLMPQGEEWNLHERARFTEVYRGRLDELGVDAIEAQLRAVYDGRPLVLLCHEDVRDGRNWCHRQVAAEVWFDWTGQPVPELDVAALPEVRP